MKIFRVIINKELNEVGIVFSDDGKDNNSIISRAIVSLDPNLINSLMTAAQEALNKDLSEVAEGTPTGKLSNALHELRAKKNLEKVKLEEEQAKEKEKNKNKSK